MLSEYRIKPVTRYVLTHYKSDPNGPSSCTTIGEYDNYAAAEKVYNAFQHSPTAHSQKYLVVMKHDWMYSPGELPDVRLWYVNTYEEALTLKSELESKHEYEWVLAELKQ
jgi:hypothetical protein